MEMLIFFGNVDFFLEIRSKNRKIKISRGSGGVRSSALDMFYTKDSTFDFLRKNKFSIFFVEKKSAEKNLTFFLEEFR